MSTAPAVSARSGFACKRLAPVKFIPTLSDDVRSGLLTPPRSLPPKYFYDARGSELFDRICETEEYYPTRVESDLLQGAAMGLIEQVQPECIVEFGSGSSRKTRHLFDACAQAGLSPGYWPMDVCEPMLVDTAESLLREYAWLNINALVGDYHGGLGRFPRTAGATLYIFLGGTIGNFEHAEAVDVLSDIRRLMRSGDHLLLGFDRVKDTAVLEAAYNDQQGVTAEFNLNLLRVLNRDLQANFQADGFCHQALYNEEANQVEMYLVSQAEQTVRLAALRETLYIRADERIRTEISRKFTPDEIELLLSESGLMPVAHHEADQAYYSLLLTRPITPAL